VKGKWGRGKGAVLGAMTLLLLRRTRAATTATLSAGLHGGSSASQLSQQHPDTQRQHPACPLPHI